MRRLSLLGSGSASAAACGTTRTRRATGGRTSTRGGSSTSKGSSRPSRSSSPTDTASARTSSGPSSRTSEISGGRSSDSGPTDFTPGNHEAIDIRRIQSIATESHFCSSLLIVYEGANPAIRRRLISRESSMGTSEATSSVDAYRTEEEEEIQGARRRTSCLNMNDIVVYMLLHKSALRNPSRGLD